MTSSDIADVVVLGDGLVGLSCARAAAARGHSCVLVGRHRIGAASGAAAGLIAPTVDPARGAALAFTVAARDRYASFLDELRGATGHDVPLALDGILRLPKDERDVRAMAGDDTAASRWLSSDDVAALEPALLAPFGARFHPRDGRVDNRRLLQALNAAIALADLPRVEADAVRLEMADAHATVELDSGRRIRTAHVVVATGAWAPYLNGLPRPLPVRPLRGQMMALATPTHLLHPLTRPVFGHGGYLVPRPLEQQVLVGSTSETVGFTTGTTDAALAGFRRLAGRLVPALARADEARSWSGFRPMTLDGLPIIGLDPEAPALVYACGHSRNGILLAPLTGDVVAALISGDPPSHDLTPFSPSRFVPQTRALS